LLVIGSAKAVVVRAMRLEPAAKARANLSTEIPPSSFFKKSEGTWRSPKGRRLPVPYASTNITIIDISQWI
jgi:hypothetical protein